MKCRKNVKDLTTQEKTNFINAFLALKNQDSIIHPGAQSRYDDFVEVHLNAMWNTSSNSMRPLSWAHGGSVFLPWHREMIYQFEKLLQTVDPSVILPYWDWTRAQAPGDTGYPFTHPFLGVDGDDGDNDRVKRESGAPSPYPYDFDSEDWSTGVDVSDPGDSLNFFQRQFGERADAPGLPENDTVVTGTTTTFRAAINSAISYTALRARSEDLHNLVHRWTGGNMLRMTSPNDPIFFLHHAAIDRMWSIWQAKVPGGTTLYVQSHSTLGHKLNDAMLFNDSGETPPFTTGATPNQTINGHTMHGNGVWYDTDIPEIDTPSATLDFVDIPEGLTSFKAVKFRIKGCRETRFRITGAPTGNFGLTPMGTVFFANPVEADDFFYGYVWVQLTSVAGSIPNSSVNVQAYIIDPEGYYATTEGGEFILGDYSVTLTATSLARESNSIALVLDRSGSMSAPAGGTSTRSQLVRNAIGVFRDLMLPADEISVVTFDDVVATPITIQAVSGAPNFATVDLTPRNMTWIGGGIQAGAVQLAGATHVNRSMIVLTDGNENIHPFISELPAGTVNNRTHAIGFGLSGQVSDAALQAITSNTSGDLIITGNMVSEEQRFHLTKYFVQILAGVTSADVVLDPDGKLFFGTKDVIPFYLSNTDVFVDAICLCPIPEFLEFVLETPNGQIIKPATVSTSVKYVLGQQVVFYRMTLPALPKNTSGSHGGEWKAIIALKTEDQIKRLMRSKKLADRKLSPFINDYLPYSFLVHTTSNLKFNVQLQQESFRPGSKIRLSADLKEYDVPFVHPATLWAEIIDPKENAFTLNLAGEGNGQYSVSFETKYSGIYICRVRAEGATSYGSRFRREKTLTASTFHPNDNGSNNGRPDSTLCDLLNCLVSNKEKSNDKLFEKLVEMGFDKKQIRECLEKISKQSEMEIIPAVFDKRTLALLKKPQTVSKLKLKKANLSKEIKHEARETTTLRKTKEQIRSFKTMFTPLDLKKEEKKSGKRKKGS